MMRDQTGKLALLWPRDATKWHAATPRDYRLSRVFDAMAALGVEAEPALYSDDVADQGREQLLGCDGVLVWIDPLSGGGDRVALDALLRDVASNGVWVSAHPDVILKMGVKEVLYRTRSLGWGTDTHLYATPEDFRARFPSVLAAAGPRVLKQNRGNGGQGVWKVALAQAAAPCEDASVEVLHAQRGSEIEPMSLKALMDRCQVYFAGSGRLIDQP